MSHEFPVEELLECTRCGEVLPYGLMTFLDDGQILCLDCYDEMMVAEDEYVDEEDDFPSEVQLSDFASLMQNISIATETADSWSRRLSFIRQLPDDLRNEFIRSIHSDIDPFIDRLLMNKTDGLTVRDFIAVDVETANCSPSSICSIGMVFVREGKIVDRFYSLVHPEPDYYAYACQRVHGLGPADTDRAPNFKKVWNKVRNRVKKDGVPFIAHNASFDEGCLKAVFRTYCMDYPDYWFLDTLKASRRYYGKSLPNHQLQTVAMACGYDLRHHHHALADAEACAAIALKIMPLTAIL